MLMSKLSWVIQIGEISLVKDFTSSMDVYMTDEERAEMEADGFPIDATKTATSTEGATGPSTTESSAAGSSTPPATTAGATESASTEPEAHGHAHHHGHMTLHTGGSGTSTPVATGSTSASATTKSDLKATKGKPKLTPEQKAKLEKIEAEKEKARAERIETLTKNMIQRIRPFVEAKRPGDVNDAETKAFEQKTRLEADDLKLESFGVELLHTIGNVYMQKSSTFVKSKKFYGGGFLGRMKE